MYSEDDLLPISALQHLLFCERQCALIHVEQLWADNRLTVEGSHLHRKADEGPDESRPGVRIARSVPLRSFRLGLSGLADVVEFQRADANEVSQKSEIVLGERLGFEGERGSEFWRPIPVEYKRGRPKRDRSDEVQLCAQALCLEEMLGVEIPRGALFYGKTRRRTAVPIDSKLRRTTEEAAERVHELVVTGQTPSASRESKCERCSLLNLCLPGGVGGRSASRYLQRGLAGIEQ